MAGHFTVFDKTWYKFKSKIIWVQKIKLRKKNHDLSATRILYPPGIYQWVLRFPRTFNNRLRATNQCWIYPQASRHPTCLADCIGFLLLSRALQPLVLGLWRLNRAEWLIWVPKGLFYKLCHWKWWGDRKPLSTIQVFGSTCCLRENRAGPPSPTSWLCATNEPCGPLASGAFSTETVRGEEGWEEILTYFLWRWIVGYHPKVKDTLISIYFARLQACYWLTIW